MIKIISSFIFLIIFSSNVMAQKTIDKDPNIQQIPLDVAQDYPEVYLENESILNHKNNSTGVITDPHYTGHESNRLSLAYQGSLDYTNFTEVSSIDLQYQFRSKSYTDVWWAFQFKSTTAKYNALADELTGDTSNPDSDSNTLRTDSLQNISSLGIGAGYRFKLLFSFNESEHFFEHVTAFLTYNTTLDNSTDRAYQGWGYNADYSLLYRSGNSLYYGLKFSYNLAAVVRGAISKEKQPDRSLVYGWSNIGFEIGYYY